MLNYLAAPKKFINQLDRFAPWLLILGSAAAIFWNLRLWQRDRRQIAACRQKEMPGQNMNPASEAPLISILLPAWNESQNLDACVQSLLELRYPNKQLIISAGGSDGTFARAQSYASHSVIVLEQKPGQGKQRALRDCYKYAAGEIIYLTDADCLVDDSAFERTIAPVIAGTEQAATGAWRPMDHQVEIPLVQHQWAHHVYRELWMPDYAPALDGRNAAISRAALEDTGAFNIDAPIGTDYVLSRQLILGGHTIKFVPSSHVQTAYPATVKAYWRQLSRWFRNPVILGWQWDERPLALGVLLAGLKSWFMVAAPLAALLLRSPLFLGTWLVGLLHLWLGAVRFMSVLVHTEKDMDASFQAYARLLQELSLIHI
jgi:cellulose synthase/poly-beta-1,6-N-acetylglucosamine synthase-like glycosyltransferase